MGIARFGTADPAEPIVADRLKAFARASDGSAGQTGDPVAEP